jgi:hypothetical protein
MIKKVNGNPKNVDVKCFGYNPEPLIENNYKIKLN